MNDFGVAVIGCGYWGKNLVRNFFHLGVLKAICEPTPQGQKMAAEVAPGVEILSTIDEVLKRKDVTAVAIATPAETHHTLALRAFAAGRDVFVEKPLALDVVQGEEMCRAAEAAKRILMVGHLLQYHPHVQKIYAMIAEGDLGRLQYVTSNRLNLGKIRREENALWSFAPHDLSVVISLAGNRLPEMVRCQGEAWLTKNVADTTLTTMKFGGGFRAHVYVSWLNPFKEQKITIVGSQGMLVFDDTKPWDEKLIMHRQPLDWSGGGFPVVNPRNSAPVQIPSSEPLREECIHFMESCRNRSVPRTDGREGLRVLAVLQAAQASLDGDGAPVAPMLHRAPRLGNERGIDQVAIPLAEGSPYLSHETAVIDAGASIGKGTKIWHFSHVSGKAKIGQKCNLGQNVFVADDVVLGSNVKVQNNVSIYSGTIVEDDVFLGPSCVLTNVSNPRSQVLRHSIYEKTIIQRGATVGANATIVCGLSLGRYSFVAAGSVVTKDIPDYGFVKGNPARLVGWMSRHGHILKADDLGNMKCPESGFRYVSDGKGGIRCLDLDESAPLPTEYSVGTNPYRAYKPRVDGSL